MMKKMVLVVLLACGSVSFNVNAGVQDDIASSLSYLSIDTEHSVAKPNRPKGW